MSDVDDGVKEPVKKVDFDEIERQWLEEVGCDDGYDEDDDGEYVGGESGSDSKADDEVDNEGELFDMEEELFEL